MRDAKPGDMCYVSNGAYLLSAVDNEARWNEHCASAIVVSTTNRVIENDEGEVSGVVIVMIANVGLFKVDEAELMTPDEYGDAGRLFPPTRIREW